MFGYHKAKRAKKRAKKAEAQLKQKEEAFSNKQPEIEAQNQEIIKQKVNEDAAQAKEDRTQARQEGRDYAKDVLSQKYEGLDPQERKMMQYEANKQVKRGMQSANRNMLGNQSTHGISPKSGVAYAQQRDLYKQGQSAMGQNQRDLDKLDSDLAMKKLAASFGIEQGEAAQSQLDKQMALDALKLEEEKKKQRYYEDQFNRTFNRV